MKKKITLVFILLILILSGIFYIDSTIFAPQRLVVNYQTITDESFDNLTICFFSDLHYDTLVDTARFEQVVDEINSLAPDIVIFGGDLFDDTYKKYPSGTTQQTAINLLSSIDAPLGKYAVLGDYDCINDITRNAVTTILTKANFEILDNSCIKIRSNGVPQLCLVGITSKSPDVDAAYEKVSPTDYSIAISHDPEIISSIVSKGSKRLLAGHTMGNQLNIPFYRMEQNQTATYLKGQYTVADMVLDVTTGVGLTEFAARFNCDAEIILYRLTSD